MVFWARKFFGAYKLPSNSISQLRGVAPSCFKHFISAERMANTIPRRSIICAEENETAKSNFFSRRRFCSFIFHSSRERGVNFFESLTPSVNCQSKFLGTATAPTATGPASGPRPTSSIPMIYFALFTALLYPCYTSVMSAAQEKDFVHLHTHSHYSLLEALPQIPALVDAAAADGARSLALTDNGNLYGAISFYKKCKEKSIKPIIGVDFFVAPRTMAHKEHRVDDSPTRLILLAKNKEGYRNLMQLVTKSHLEGFFVRPRIDRELIALHRGGLIAILPAMDGEHARALRDKATTRAKESLVWHSSIFDADCYAEITHHPEIEGHEKLMNGIESLAREAHIGIVAAHEVYYMKKEDAVARELVDKIRTAGVLNRDFAENAPDFSFQPRAKTMENFKEYPEALENSMQIADECNLELKLGTWVFPEFPIPEGATHDEVLRKLAYDGFRERQMPETEKNKVRVDYELSVIAEKGYSPYFLVVADLLRHAREKGILTNTRGSAAGSLVSYLSGITTVNPIEYQLPFERFLNPERPSPPDIDMDLADNRRDELIDYVRAKYGETQVAQIGTFGTMMARAAVRDVARALGYP